MRAFIDHLPDRARLTTSNTRPNDQVKVQVLIKGKGEGLLDTSDLFDSLSRLREFTVTDNHLKLLRHMRVRWLRFEFFGAPIIDNKRPYGNSGVATDVAEIVQAPDSDYEWTEKERITVDGERKVEQRKDLRAEAEDRYLRMHVETGIVLQIALATGEFRPGRYRREGYIDWKRDDSGS